MVKNKYGDYSTEQMEHYKTRVHSWIHWLLIYEEEKNPILESYFSKLQNKLEGLNSLLNYPTELVEIMNLVESASIEYSNQSTHNHKTYRKMIFDIHELVDRLPNGE